MVTPVALSEEQKRARAEIPASFVPYLVRGDQEKIRRTWERAIGHPDYVEEDLSNEWLPSFGSYVEPFALDWHERKTGLFLGRRGESVRHPKLPYVSCTLDAWRREDDCVIDVKTLGPWRKLDEACHLYRPQMVVQKACVGALRASLLIVHGGAEPVEFPLTWDSLYEDAVWDRIDWFWNCVQNFIEPYALPPVEPPVEATKTIDMDGNNAFSVEAAIWLGSRDYAKKFEVAAKELKAMVPADCREAWGYGVKISRSKAGALTIKEWKK